MGRIQFDDGQIYKPAAVLGHKTVPDYPLRCIKRVFLSPPFFYAGLYIFAPNTIY